MQTVLPDRSRFPKGFVFGTATASYQIEGSGFGGCGVSHWDEFAKQPGAVYQGQDGSVACNHYNNWSTDLDLIKECGFDSYRFSFSWPRLLPQSNDEPNRQGVEFYDRLIDGMLERGLKPCATLYHWDLPVRYAQQGGWTNRATAERFAEYADLAMTNYGDRLYSVATLNEPWCSAWLGYFLGVHAPGVKDIAAAAKAMHNILLAHGLALRVLRSHNARRAGIVLNLTQTESADQQESSQYAAKIADGTSNRWFLDALFKKSYPNDVLEIFGANVPDGYEDDLKLIGAPLDWLGINYYTRMLIAAGEQEKRTVHNDSSDAMARLLSSNSPEDGLKITIVPGELPKTDMGWEVYPEGLAILLRRVRKDYTGELPIYITENGMANNDAVSGGTVNDDIRIDYIARHLEVVREAIADGVPVRGYYCWSFMDNYEWSFGYSKRFGLVYVDYETQERIPKKSYYAFQTALKT